MENVTFLTARYTTCSDCDDVMDTVKVETTGAAVTHSGRTDVRHKDLFGMDGSNS